MQQRICTKDEIEQLHLFCKKHFVKYADVREELVDHLASAIEEQWESNETLSFDKALHNCYKQFGATGFRKVISEKEKAIRKAHNKLQIKYLLGLIKPPQVFVTILIAAILFYSIPDNSYLFGWYLGTFSALGLILNIVMIFYYNRRWKKIFTTDYILITSNAELQSAITIGPYLSWFNIVIVAMKEDIVPLWLKILGFAGFIIITLATTLCLLLLRQAEKEVIKKYPQLVK